jgi:hypothetical protein
MVKVQVEVDSDMVKEGCSEVFLGMSAFTCVCIITALKESWDM